MDRFLPFLSSAFVLCLLAGTLRSIRMNLQQSPMSSPRRISIISIETVEWLLWALTLIAITIAAPHPVTVILLIMLLASITTATKLRYQEETRSLNRWIQMATRSRTSIIRLSENLASGFHSRLGKQTRVFASRLQSGEPIVNATRRSRLPLDADTVTSFLIPTTDVPQTHYASSLAAHLASNRRTTETHVNQIESRLSPIPQQFIYVVATILLAWVFCRAMHFTMLAMLGELLREFAVRSRFEIEQLDTIKLISDVVVAGLVSWLLLALIIRWLPGWMARRVPWFGDQALTRWRCDILRCLARGIRARQPASETLQIASQTMRVRWARRVCHRAYDNVEKGVNLPTALQRSNLISSSENSWLSVAEANGNLPDALDQLVENLQRRQAIKWRLRMSWLVPTATVAVGAFVLVYAMFMFDVLSTFIRTMT
ncbi:MAG: type II secretion system F family protein [Rhodopirellula sp. JB044]|uniref:type II secretion system F family protein n=1 Tax=Rhodopirellula sp. JB044 TaxID=3342844 RepID=UPI003709F9D8